MKIAVLSGKGGTGKTFVAVNLAAALPLATYVDCDVEEPNGALFLKPEITKIESVTVEVPLLDELKCKGCRACVAFCAFHALAFVGDKPMLFSELCHACGGCGLVCPYDAITYTHRQAGKVFVGESGKINFMSGLMEVGEVSGVPIIQKLLEHLTDEGDIVLDCSPGSGCMVVETVKEADYCIIVAEPTLFGSHNMEMVYDLVNVFRKPLGVVLNKCVGGYNPAEAFCEAKHIDVIGRIPYDKTISTQNAEGQVVYYTSTTGREAFATLVQTLKKQVIR